MTEQEIEDHLRSLLVDEFEIDAADLRPEALLYDDLGLDSIDAVDLLVHLKDVTGLRVPPDQFKSVRTYSELVHILKSLVAS